MEQRGILKVVLCSHCKVAPPRVGGRLCSECHNAYMRQWRKAHRPNAEQRRKANARSQFKMALRRGLVPRLTCALCGEKAEPHHPDYQRPHYVVWLCRRHHLGVHSGSVECPPATDYFVPIEKAYKPVLQAAESMATCSKCGLLPARKAGNYCRMCHAHDMRDRRRIARKELIKAGLAKRRGRRDRQL